MYLVRSKAHSGFTLIEMMIVIAVIGILSIAVFNYPDKRSQLDAEAQQLVSDLRYAQFLAMTQNTQFRVTFSTTQYTLSDIDNNLYNWPLLGSASVTFDEGDNDFELTWDPEVLPNDYIIFDGQGVPYVSPTVKLSTTAVLNLAYDELFKTISIVPETGKVGIP